MKPVYPLLVIAAVCCFAPAMSKPVRDDEDEQVRTPKSSCLLKALNNNEKVSEDLIRFICAYMKLKAMPHKGDFIKAIKQLEDATGCTPEDIFGTENLEQLAMDENGVLTKQIIVMKYLLEQRGILMQSVGRICMILNNELSTDSGTHTSIGEGDQGHRRFTRHLPRQAGGLDVLGPVLGLAPNLLGGLLGGQGGLLSGPLDLIGGVVNLPTSLLGGLLGGGGGGQKTAHGCGGGLVNEVLDLPNGLLQGVLGGGGQKQASGLGGLVNGVVSLPSTLLGGITGGGQQQAGGVGGLLNGVVSAPSNLLGGLLGGNLLSGLLGR